MAPSKRYLPYLTFLLGFLGIVFCVAGLFCVWSLGSRLTRTSERVFRRIDESLASVQERVVEAQKRVQESRITTEGIGQSMKTWAQKETQERLTSRLEVEEKANQLVPQRDMANCTAKSIYRMITTMLVTAGKQATRRCCNARSVFEMPWWSYSDTGIFASANRVGAIVSN